MRKHLVKTLVILALLVAAPVWAEDDETALAKKTQNPVADLISFRITPTMAMDQMRMCRML